MQRSAMASILIDISQFLFKQSAGYLRWLIYNCQLQRRIVIDSQYRRLCPFYHQKVNYIYVIRIDRFMQRILALLSQLVQQIAVLFTEYLIPLTLVFHLYLFIKYAGSPLEISFPYRL